MPDELPAIEQPDDEEIGGTPRPIPPIEAAGEPGTIDTPAIPADQLESAASVDDEVERIMLEELAKAEAAGASADAGVADMMMDIPVSSFDRTIAERQELPTVKPVEFGKFDRTEPSGQTKNLDILMDVKLPVSIELGRTEMTIHDILDLTAGSVVELNKLAGEPVDLLVNNKVIAKGEVVVVDENFGLRVTSLISPEERIKSL
jgi:flagellar motor switch protein FliN